MIQEIKGKYRNQGKHGTQGYKYTGNKKDAEIQKYRDTGNTRVTKDAGDKGD